MSARELKPCPFCGGKAEIDRHGDRRQSTIYCCTECSCSLETGEEWGHGSDWNRRSGLPPGYVILSPDEVRGIRDEALEEAAKIAGDLSEQEDGAEGWLAGSSIATAIRSLKGGRDAQ